MVKVIVDKKIVEVAEGTPVIKACEEAGVEIPRFCYHDRLKIAGNCRMCLVQINGGKKLSASCAVPVSEGMVVDTKTEIVKKAREGVMEFLLINHPLDCPICDQGGECDLQDQAMHYGKDCGRFGEEKRAVEEKNLGPLIKTHMNRCIHCTRCVRFASDVIGTEDLGTFGRGENMEISTYLNRAIKSELSGNLIDLCPVGALTSKPYSYKARSWELSSTESIDVMDAVGSNIRIDTARGEVMRILPRLNEDINEEWISDKTRFACDGLKNQRLDTPYIRKGGKLTPVSWDEVLKFIAKNLAKIEGNQIGAVVGGMADAESILVLQDIMKHFKSPNVDCMQESIGFDLSHRSNYLFNTSISGIEDSDLCLLIGANPRKDASIINARIRKRWSQGNYQIFSVGKIDDELTYPYVELGDDVKALEAIVSGKSQIASALKKAKKPMMILGYGALDRSDSSAIVNLCSQIVSKYGFAQENWNGFNVLHKDASMVAALDLGFVPGNNGLGYKALFNESYNTDIKIIYLLDADDNIDLSETKGNKLIIYQGHHGDNVANFADVILPGATYIEKNATYINLEGRVQQTRKAVFPPGLAKEDSEILLMIARKLSINLPYKDLAGIREELKIRSGLCKALQFKQEKWFACGKDGKLSEGVIESNSQKYYLSNSICRASSTMLVCQQEID